MEAIQELNVFFTGFEMSWDMSRASRLRRCSVGPVWLSAASRSASTRIASTIPPTPGGQKTKRGVSRFTVRRIWIQIHVQMMMNVSG